MDLLGAPLGYVDQQLAKAQLLSIGHSQCLADSAIMLAGASESDYFGSDGIKNSGAHHCILVAGEQFSESGITPDRPTVIAAGHSGAARRRYHVGVITWALSRAGTEQ